MPWTGTSIHFISHRSGQSTARVSPMRGVTRTGPKCEVRGARCEVHCGPAPVHQHAIQRNVDPQRLGQLPRAIRQVLLRHCAPAPLRHLQRCRVADYDTAKQHRMSLIRPERRQVRAPVKPVALVDVPGAGRRVEMKYRLGTTFLPDVGSGVGDAEIGLDLGDGGE